MLAVAWVVAIPVLTSVLSLYYDEDYVAQTLNREELEAYNTNNYGFTDESLNRGTIFEKSVIFLNSPIEYVVGHGLGSGNISSFFYTDVFEIYKRTCYGFYYVVSFDRSWICRANTFYNDTCTIIISVLVI